MARIGTIAGAASLISFAIFFINVTAGAVFQARFLSDVGEMLLLFAASALFVVLILTREYQTTEAQQETFEQ